jgi:hypothetical protein
MERREDEEEKKTTKERRQRGGERSFEWYRELRKATSIKILKNLSPRVSARSRPAFSPLVCAWDPFPSLKGRDLHMKTGWLTAQFFIFSAARHEIPSSPAETSIVFDF